MEAKDYNIMYCNDGNLYINRSRWTQFRSDDSKRFSKEDLESIERWIEQNCTDALIEKALKFIKTNADRIVNNQYGVCMGCMDAEFRNYIKGE